MQLRQKNENIIIYVSYETIYLKWTFFVYNTLGGEGASHYGQKNVGQKNI